MTAPMTTAPITLTPEEASAVYALIREDAEYWLAACAVFKADPNRLLSLLQKPETKTP